ncbi:NB-ARC domain-containing protein [Nodosilinea sp. P-1105]|uniref:WD40 domain-containing protein n=1 Tax=Nodosilinea sp. P-1105 TaxID=2546229 RepID=UPI00146D801A|nr:NB-ARC domain-containing protein [Nodosilinea sp. P-1105]NMF83956.1 hypothetical protein [Nodosilinea sp. P-1105]
MAETSDGLVDDETFLQTVAQQHQVSKAELTTLRLALQKQTAETIADQLGISAAAVRKRLGAVYQKFGIVGTTPGKLEALRGLLAEHLAAYRGQRGDAISPSSSPAQIDWGEAISAIVFYDRKPELAQLRQIITGDRCRLVAILGIGGVGKTTLAVKATDQVSADFEYVIWRSLREAPTLDQILEDWFQRLPGRPEKPLDTPGQKITYLLDRLKAVRCLLVLDNFESILQRQTRAGEYRDGYANYGELLRRIGESDHQSCLVLTSREKPLEVTALESDLQRTRALQLNGSQVAAEKILADKGLIGPESARQELTQRYDGNPLAIKIVATAINDLFDGQITEFLKQNQPTDEADSVAPTVVVSNLRRLLDEQFDRLSALEKGILYWLALSREPLTLTTLRQDLLISSPPAQILGALEDLRRRSLIEKFDGAFTLQNVVMEYVTDTLIETLCQEIATNQFQVFNSHALLNTSTSDYIQDLQRRLILQPIVANLGMLVGSANLRTWVQQTLVHLRQDAKLTRGYAAGNLLNLLVALKHPLGHYDFSGLTIRHADLRWANLNHINFAKAQFSHCYFSETFGSILSIAFSPDSNYLAAGAANSEIRLWQISDQQPVHNLTGHLDWVWALAFASDHAWLASGSADGEVRLWNTKTGSAIRTFPRHNARIWHVSFHHQDQWLVSGSDDGEVRLWAINSHHATGITTEQPVVVIQNQGTKVRSLGISPNSRTIAIGKYDGTIDIWAVDLQHPQRPAPHQHQLAGHQGRVLAISFSPQGNLMASTDEAGIIQIWDTHHWTLLNRFPRNSHRIRTAAFSPDGTTLVSGSDKGHMGIWHRVNELDQGTGPTTLSGHTNWIWSVAFSPNGRQLASGSEDQSIKLWSAATGKCLATLQGRNNRILSLAVHPQQDILASGSEDHAIWLWRSQDQHPYAQLCGHQNRVRAVAFSPTGDYLASSGDDQLVKVWAVTLRECVQTFTAHQDWVRTVAFSPDGKILASGSDDQTIRLWSLPDGQWLTTLKGHRAGVLSVAFSPDSTHLASASEDKTVKLWHIHTERCVETLRQHASEVLSVAFSPDGAYLASGGADKQIYVWDVASFSLVHTLSKHTAPVRAVAFDPQGQYLASGSDDKTVILWDLASGQPSLPLTGHTRYVSAVAFGSQGRDLYSSGNQSICHWDSQTKTRLGTVSLDKPYEGVNIAGATGLSSAQVINLKVLGATDAAIDPLAPTRRSP